MRIQVFGLLLAGCVGGGATGGAASAGATGGNTESGGTPSALDSTTGSGGAASGTGGVSAAGGTSNHDTGSGGAAPACQTGNACLTVGDPCATQAGCCVCEVVPACGDEAQWSCIEPSTDPSCGSDPPEAGSACSSAGLECFYCIQQRPRGRVCSFAGKWLDFNGFRNCR